VALYTIDWRALRRRFLARAPEAAAIT
jgi:hypothetical protein